MKAQQRLDRILEPITERVQEEVGALMGVTFKLSPSENELLAKENCFLQLSGQQIAVKMDVTGEIEGKGCLLISVKDAIRLGGTLIMLPPTELDEVIRNEDYNEETEDSYGEIANIIAGCYTKVFEDMYPDNCRFVRKEQELLAPMKVDIESDEPIPNQPYYLTSSKMTLDGTEMGDLVMLIPAETFGIDISAIQEAEKAAPQPAVQAESSDQTDEGADEAQAVDIEESAEGAISSGETVTPATEDILPEGSASSSTQSPTSPKISGAKLEKQRKRVDGILDTCGARMAEEVGALLGVDVKITDLVNKPISKEDFLLEETKGKQVIAHMEVVDDDIEDNSFLFVSLKDAIRIGGVLIMLPPSEIEVAVAEEDFSVDAEDAYGEIANIISGVYTAVFQEMLSSNIRFIKTDLEEVSPMKVDAESDEVFPNIFYYLSSGKIAIDGNDLGQVQMLFPAELLSLDGLEQGKAQQDQVVGDTVIGASETSGSGVAAGSAQAVAAGVGGAGSRPDTDILIIGDDEVEIAKIIKYVNGSGHVASVITLKDNVANYIGDNIKIIFLVMREVGEQSFGVVIKVSSVCSVPLIAAGPGWTRSKVINAVKYGVNDILLTPATDTDIREKVETNLVEMAA